MRLFIDCCHFLAALVIAPFLLVRSWRTGKYRTDWDQRRGHMPDLPATAPGHPRVWVHAVSVGEMNAVRGLIQKWREQQPQTEFIISCTTDTGKARARELFPDLQIIRYPLDFSRFVSRALDRIKPSLIVLVELEVWFQFVTLASRRGIPVTIVNGRLSEKSARWFARIRPIARRMFGALTWVGAQDESYAKRFRRLRVPAERVSVTGSLKWETAQITDTIPGAQELARAMGIHATRETMFVKRRVPDPQKIAAMQHVPCLLDDSALMESDHEVPGYPIWVCGSTGPGEEEILLQAYQKIRAGMNLELPNLQLVLVPRKPERFAEVATLIEQRGFVCVRRSRCPDGTSRMYDPNVIHLVDTMGELRKVCSLADVVFVGRSLVPMGGSDMMEVAALGKPILVGPHTENFRDAMQQLQNEKAIWVVENNFAECLPIMLSNVLTDLEWRTRMGQAAREVVRKNLGATQRTLDRLVPLVSARPSA